METQGNEPVDDGQRYAELEKWLHYCFLGLPKFIRGTYLNQITSGIEIDPELSEQEQRKLISLATKEAESQPWSVRQPDEVPPEYKNITIMTTEEANDLKAKIEALTPGLKIDIDADIQEAAERDQ